MNGAVSMHERITFGPIGYFQTSKKQNLEASSQGVLDPQSTGIIDLSYFPQAEEMLSDLGGFSHLWIIFFFHHHHGHWKSKVLPPRAAHKVGVFASRSPYRPNAIGISAVKIDRIEKNLIHVSGHDLIDGTPILDIKPYLPYADSFPEAHSGWVSEAKEYNVKLAPRAQIQIAWLQEQGLKEFASTLQQQLRFHPTDHRRKRVRRLKAGPSKAQSQPPTSSEELSSNSSNNGLNPSHQSAEIGAEDYVFSYRTWRVRFQLQADEVHVLEITSGYLPNELEASAEDPYLDKELHRNFSRKFT